MTNHEDDMIYGDPFEEDDPFSDLEPEEMPDMFDGDEERGGISRTFRIVFALLLLAVFAIVILIIIFAVTGDDPEADAEKTRVAAEATNNQVETLFAQTQTAIVIRENATNTAVAEIQATGTSAAVTAEAEQTQSAAATATAAQDQIFQDQTATAVQQEADANATATAAQEATQRAEETRIAGTLTDPDNNVLANVPLRLYRDDGDGVFTPPVTAPPGNTAGEGSGEGLGGDTGPAQAISYGETAQGTLQTSDAVVEYRFTGAAGDTITIDAVAADAIQTDMFLELVDPLGEVVETNDDGGDGTNARIAEFALSEAGSYTIRVSSVAGAGAFSLTLSAGASPEAAGDEAAADGTADEGLDTGGTGDTPDTPPTTTGDDLTPVAPPTQESVSRAPGLAAPALQGTPTPESGDDLIDTVITDDEGNFDFGSLPEGVYFIELPYDLLPDDIKPLVPEGESTVVRVEVPTGGAPVSITLGGDGPPDDGGPTGPELTLTAAATLDVVTPSPTMEPGISPTASVTAIGKFGLFSDGDGGSGDLEGSSGLAILAIAAAGLVAVVFIARRLRAAS